MMLLHDAVHVIVSSIVLSRTRQLALNMHSAAAFQAGTSSILLSGNLKLALSMH